MHRAMLFTQQEDGSVQCHVCAHQCVISPGQRGICGVRENRDGTLFSLVYGYAVTGHADPIEKKPFYHVAPGTHAFSVAAVGCNFRCAWCQNHDISQCSAKIVDEVASRRMISSESLIESALRSGCTSIAYTYTEPTVFFEYAYDTARMAVEHDLLNLFVTNGYISRQALEKMAPYLDGANVDLKAFRESTYRTYIGGKLAPVLDTLLLMKKLGIWIEVTTLLIPTINDDEMEMREIAAFISGELGPETPWHVSAFRPAWKMKEFPPTPPETLRRAVEIGQEEGVQNIYKGNIGERNVLHCAQCGKELLKRHVYEVLENSITTDGTCPDCGTPVPGVQMGG